MIKATIIVDPKKNSKPYFTDAPLENSISNITIAAIMAVPVSGCSKINIMIAPTKIPGLIAVEMNSVSSRSCFFENI